MNGRDYIIKLNPYELGFLHGIIMQLDDKDQRALKPICQQLVELKRQFEQEAGVKKEVLPGGMLKITDKDGNMIIRAPYPFETEGN